MLLGTPSSMPLTEVMGTSSIAFRMDLEMSSLEAGHGDNLGHPASEQSESRITRAIERTTVARALVGVIYFRYR